MNDSNILLSPLKKKIDTKKIRNRISNSDPIKVVESFTKFLASVRIYVIKVLCLNSLNFFNGKKVKISNRPVDKSTKIFFSILRIKYLLVIKIKCFNKNIKKIIFKKKKIDLP